MAVPVDDDRKSRSLRLQIQFVQVVQNVDRHAADFKHIGGRNFPRPSGAIHVAANRGDGRNLGQLFQDGGIADVPGMNDVVGTAQRGESLRAKQAVSIRDNADESPPPT